MTIRLKWKKLPRAGSFDPLKRQEFDRRNQEIYALYKQDVTVRELAQQYGFIPNGVCHSPYWHAPCTFY